MIVGDFNYQFGYYSQPYSLFKQITESLGLYIIYIFIQHINYNSHDISNILDLILTPSDILLQIV